MPQATLAAGMELTEADDSTAAYTRYCVELLDAGWPKPALILGFPVGFVGAAESKAELAANPRMAPVVGMGSGTGGG